MLQRMWRKRIFIYCWKMLKIHCWNILLKIYCCKMVQPLWFVSTSKIKDRVAIWSRNLTFFYISKKQKQKQKPETIKSMQNSVHNNITHNNHKEYTIQILSINWWMDKKKQWSLCKLYTILIYHIQPLKKNALLYSREMDESWKYTN